jgi:hypothetical protein
MFLELVGELRGRVLRRSIHEQANVVGLDREVLDSYLKLRSLVSKQSFEVRSFVAGEHRKAILWRPNEVLVEVGDAARRGPMLHTGSILGRHSKTNYLTRRKGGEMDFLCPSKGEVPVRYL